MSVKENITTSEGGIKSMRQYPRLGEYGTGYVNYRKTCEICRQPNRHVLSVQYSWFRGDDEVMNICQKCRKWKTDQEVIDFVFARERSKATHE